VRNARRGQWAFTGVVRDDEIAQLAAAAAGGDAAARERLLPAAAGPARRMAGRLVDDRHSIEDVVQESLAEVYATIGTLREPAAFVSWLALVVRKQADRHRRRQRPTVLLDLALEHLPTATDPATAAERGERIDSVRRALALATDADRSLLGLRYYADWSDAQLAELLGISPGAVRKRLYDARRRLRPALAAHQPIKEHSMTDVRTLFGTVTELAGAPEPPAGTALQAPTPGAVLSTGIKVIDALAPWPRGGTVDFLGPVGTGHLVVLGEIIHNLLARGSATLIALASTQSTDSWPRLEQLVDAPARPTRTFVLRAPTDDAVAALDYAWRWGTQLAESGDQVLLTVDRMLADRLGPDAFAERVGVTRTGGSVTGIRVAPNAPAEGTVAAWPGAGAVTVTSGAELAAGRYPAIDVLASSSTVLRHTDPRQQQVAEECRRVLNDAQAVRAYLTQNFWMAEDFTGISGESYATTQAVTGLAELISH